MLNKEENEGKQAGLYENKKNYYFTGKNPTKIHNFPLKKLT